MLFVKPIKGKKAKTVTCQDAVVHTAKKAEAKNIHTKQCISVNINEPVKADTVMANLKQVVDSDCKKAHVNPNNKPIIKPSSKVSNDLKLKELFQL